jgi:hypothetical protein
MPGPFGAAVRRFADDKPRLIEQGIRRATIDMFSRVVLRTPVDTGRARGGWSFSEGGPARGSGGRLDPGGGAAIGAITGGVSGARIGDGTEHWLTNTVPYIERLENGYSRQAPAGMVKVTVAEFRGAFERIVAAAVG